MLQALLIASVLCARPPAAISLPSARGFPFLVHGPLGSDALVAKVRDAADVSWQAEMVDGAWPPPPPDQGGPDGRFDFYIDASMRFPVAYTLGEDEVPATPWFDQTSYIVLPGDFPNGAALFSTVAHELNHASQYAIDAAEEDAFFEHTAVMVEQKVAKDFTSWGVGISDYQGHPERALTYLDADWYEYGAGLWLIFLSEHLDQGGYRLVQRLWNDSRQPGPSNHPSFIDALDGILRERGMSRRQFFSTLSTWRYFTGARDDRLHFAGGGDWGPSSLVPVVRQDLGSPVRIDGSLGAFGAKWVELTLPPGAVAVTMTVDSLEAGAALVPLSANGVALGPGAVSDATGSSVRLEVPAGTALVLAALTSTPAAYDPATRPFAAATLGATITVELAAETESDAGVGNRRPPMGCGCGSTTADGISVLAALFLAATRRRREFDRASPRAPPLHAQRHKR